MEEGSKTNNLEVNGIQFPLEKEFKEKLKIFLVFLKQDTTIPVNQNIGAVIAYHYEEAVNKAVLAYPGRNIFYNGDFVLADEILKKIQIEGNISIAKPIELIEFPQPKMSKESFVASLRLVVDDFLKGKDAEVLKKIIEKIK